MQPSVRAHEAILNAMRSFPDVDTVQAAGCAALAVIAVNGPSCAPIHLFFSKKKLTRAAGPPTKQTRTSASC